MQIERFREITCMHFAAPSVPTVCWLLLPSTPCYTRLRRFCGVLCPLTQASSTDDQAHPAGFVYIHRDAVMRLRAGVRGDCYIYTLKLLVKMPKKCVSNWRPLKNLSIGFGFGYHNNTSYLINIMMSHTQTCSACYMRHIQQQTAYMHWQCGQKTHNCGITVVV